MHETNSQFILLKIPPHSVRLLGKIHALSIEVLNLLSEDHPKNLSGKTLKNVTRRILNFKVIKKKSPYAVM